MNFYSSNKSHIILIFIMLVAGVIAAVVYARITTTEPPPGYFDVKIHKDKNFPDTDLTSYDSKLKLNSEVKRGKVLLVYMQTGCPGCKLQADVLRRADLQKKFGIKVYLVGYETSEDWTKFNEEHKLNFPVFRDKDHTLRKTLEVGSFPFNFLVNNGKIERSWRGISKEATLEELYKNLSVVGKRFNRGVNK